MASEEQRFQKAFLAETARAPDVAPGPTRLNWRMGHKGKPNRLNGRLTKLRREMLLEAGFKKDPKTGRWEK